MDKYTVRNSVGEVDVAESAEAYARALTHWVDTHEMSMETVRVAVNSVFDSHPGRRILTPALVSAAVNYPRLKSWAFCYGDRK